MKASSFPKEFRAYDLDSKVMLDSKALITRGFTLSPDGLPSCASENLFNVVLLWFSGQLDKNGKKIFEGDICRVNVDTGFGSVVVDYGVMRFNRDVGAFMLLIPSAQGGHMLKVVEVELLGNEFENDELVPLIKNKPVTTNG